MALADYLAKKYLIADLPEKKPKKRKRKDEARPGFIIADDDAFAWGKEENAADEDDAPLNGKFCEYINLARHSHASSRFR